jgi:hypothetical protein
MKSALAVLISTAVTACAATPPQERQLETATPITLNAKQVAAVRDGVTKSLKDPESARFGRMIGGRTSGGVMVCGYVNAKNSFGGYIGEKPFHGVILGSDNASSFAVTGMGGQDNETGAVFEICRRSGLELL